MSYSGYPGQNSYNRSAGQQPYNPNNAGYSPYNNNQQGGYQQPYQPPPGYAQPPSYGYQQPPGYGVAPTYPQQQQQQPHPYQPYQPPPQQNNQPGYNAYHPYQPQQPQQSPHTSPPAPYQPPGYQPPQQQQPPHAGGGPAPGQGNTALPPPSRELKELTLALVKECKRFQDVVASVRDVALTNRLAYSDGPRAFNDIAVACWDTQMFGVSVTEHVSNTGVSSRVLVMRGILPILFKGRQYQTPLEIFIPTRYPHEGPIPYVVPTNDMRITPNNPYVSPDGLVNIEYLRDWKPSSSFAQMLTTMSSAFGQRPPLYAVQPGTGGPSTTATPHGRPRTPSSAMTPSPAFSPAPSGHSGSGYGGQSTQSPPPYHTSSPTNNQQPMSPNDQYIPFEIPSNEADRRNVLQQIVEIKLAAAQTMQYKDLSKKINDLNNEKRELSSKQFVLAHSVRSKADMLTELKRINNLLESDIDNAKKSIDQQQALLHDNNTVDEHGNKVFHFEKLVHFDGLSTQAITEVACDRAYDDVLTQLDALLSGGQVNIDTYLKEVRVNARRQFMSRALATKINQAM